MCTTCPAADLENIQDVRQIIQDSLSQLIPTQCGVGLWQQVAYLNMSDPLQQCPSNWSEYNHNGIRACRRPLSTVGSCSSIFFAVNQQYTGSGGMCRARLLDDTYIKICNNRCIDCIHILYWPG